MTNVTHSCSLMIRAGLVLLLATLGGSVRGGESSHGNAAATQAVSATATEPRLPVVPSPREINPALRDSADELATTNIIEQHTTAPGSSKLADLEAMMDWGKRMKQERNFEAAENCFVMIMKAQAPEAMHRTAMLELALSAQENQQFTRAQQIYSQYLERYTDDPSAAEVCLRQGLLYRQMGAPTMALSKFYAVMTTALRLKLDRLEYYQRLVLQAQAEIADTYYLQGKFDEAAEFLGRLLKLESPQLNKPLIIYKLIRSLACLNRHTEVVARAEYFINNFAEAAELAEVRFLLADALKKQGRAREATQQVLLLLESQHGTAKADPANWAYWQQRTGNEIANQLYKEGDYLNALTIYQNLAQLDDSAAWQLPVWYQMGLVYERLMQPARATEWYDKILERQKELDSTQRTPSLDTVLDMARWRKEQLQWQLKAEAINASFNGASAAPVALSAK